MGESQNKPKILLDRKEVVQEVNTHVYNVVTCGYISDKFPEVDYEQVEDVITNNIRFESENNYETIVQCDVQIIFCDSSKEPITLVALVSCKYPGQDIRAIGDADTEILNLDYC